MNSFIRDDFLLQSAAARDLYRGYAQAEPIYDYHCHVPPEQIASNHQFADLSEAWLGGDHYKWRAMRANGVGERFCTGDATPREKFDAWVATVPHTLGNPLYHWSHLELLRCFGIDALISAETADMIWERANARLPALRVHDILAANRVAVVCTTDDPADPLDAHETIRRSGLRTRVYPAFRPDRALGAADPAAFNPWVERLAGAARTGVRTFDDFLGALKTRHDDFHAVGCRLSDHGMETALAEPCSHAQAAAIFTAARGGRAAGPDESARFGAYLMLEFGRWDARLDEAAAPRRPAQRQHAAPWPARPQHGIRLDRGFPAGAGAWALPRRPRRHGRAAAHGALQRQPVRQLRSCDDGRELPGRLRRGKDPVRRRLVVPRPEGGDGVAAGRALQYRPAPPLRRDADRLAQLPQLPAPRVLPARAVQPARLPDRAWRAATRPGARRGHGAANLLRQRARLFRARARPGLLRGGGLRAREGPVEQRDGPRRGAHRAALAVDERVEGIAGGEELGAPADLVVYPDPEERPLPQRCRDLEGVVVDGGA